MTSQFVLIHSAAPEKPPLGMACNGCGICCAAEPCPLARWLLWQFSGSCRALVWDEQNCRYYCDLVQHPQYWLRRLPLAWLKITRRFLARRIAAGQGCDSDASTTDPNTG